MTDYQEVTRAKEALQILDSNVYKDAMSALQTQIIQQWKDCPIRDAEGQLLLLQLAKLAEKFESILRGYVESGKLAQHRIDIDKERSDTKVRRWLRNVA